MACMKSMLLPLICSSLALLFFVGYSLWFWIKKPTCIIIDYWLSNLNVAFTLYFLIVMAMDAPNQWWYITPIALSVVLLFIALINNQEERFDI